MKLDDTSRSFKATSVPWDDSMLSSGPFLGGIACMAAGLKGNRDWPPLDASATSEKIRVFNGGQCLDFNITLSDADAAQMTVEKMMGVLRSCVK